MVSSEDSKGFLERIFNFTKTKSSLYATQSLKETYLRSIIRENKLKALRESLLDDKIDINQSIVKETKHTLLHEAISLNRYEAFNLILLMKADPNVPCELGIPPLVKAAGLGRLNMVKRLLESGADPNAITPRGESALAKAKLFDQWEVIEFLEDHQKQFESNSQLKPDAEK